MEIPVATVSALHAMSDGAFPELQNLPPIKWVGRELRGAVYRCRHGLAYEVIVIFKKKRYYQLFSSTKYGTLENAKLAADRWRESICIEHGMFDNEFGYYVDPETKNAIGVVKLTQGRIMFFSPAHESFVLQYRWWCASKGGATFYAQSHEPVTQAIRLFHRLIFPDSEIVDHLNYNGLDNRLENIRPVTASINLRNRRISPAGIFRASGYECHIWVSAFKLAGKTIRKSFAVKKYTEDGARALAIAFRQANAWAEPDATTGLPPGVCRSCAITKGSWIAYWTDDKQKNRSVSFSVAKYGEQEAKSRAEQARREAEKRFGYL